MQRAGGQGAAGTGPGGREGAGHHAGGVRCDDERDVIRRKIAHYQKPAKLEHEKLDELEATLANEEVRTHIDLQWAKADVPQFGGGDSGMAPAPLRATPFDQAKGML